MGLSREKRRFLVKMLGEERTKAIEDELARHGKELEEAGIDFKDLGANLSACVNGVCEGTADTANKAQRIPEPRRSYLIGLFGQQRIDEIEAEGPGHGGWQHYWGPDPVQGYVNDVRGGRRPLSAATKTALKALEDSDPIGKYVRDLFRGRTIQGDQS
jgi:hypothetical protein